MSLETVPREADTALDSWKRPRSLNCIVCVCGQSHQSCSTLWDFTDYSPPASSVHGIFWNELPCPPPGNLHKPGTGPASPGSPTLQVDSSPLSHQGSRLHYIGLAKNLIGKILWKNPNELIGQSNILLLGCVLATHCPILQSIRNNLKPHSCDGSNTFIFYSLKGCSGNYFVLCKKQLFFNWVKESGKYQHISVNTQWRQRGRPKWKRHYATWSKIQASLDWTSDSKTPFIFPQTSILCLWYARQGWGTKHNMMNKAKLKKAHGLMVRNVLMTKPEKKTQHHHNHPDGVVKAVTPTFWTRKGWLG